MRISLLKSALCLVAMGAAATAFAAEVQPFAMPVNITPTQSEYDRFTVVNANGDLREWSFDADNSCIKYNYSSTRDADDWVFIPVTLTAADTYLKVSVEALATGASSWYDEKFEIAIGATATAADMHQVLNQTVSNGSYTTYEATFANTLTGTAWLGIHATSPKNRRTLQMRNIKLVATAVPMTPMAPEVVSAACDGFDLTAVVKAPAKTMQGNDITVPLTIRMNVDGTMAEEKTAVAAGAEVTFTRQLAKGSHQLTFVAVLDNNGTIEESAAATATVEAKNNNASYALPFTFGPANQTEFNECTIIDNNGDDKTWEYKTGAFYYSYNSNAAANDWVVLPAINFGDTKTIEVSIEACCLGASYPEAFDVRFATDNTVAAINRGTVLIEEEELKSTAWKQYKVTCEIPGGIGYIALHATSAADRYGLYLRNINIVDPNPAPLVGIDSVISGEEGEAEYYTLQGIRVSEPVKGQMLIKRQGAKATKVIIR